MASLTLRTLTRAGDTTKNAALTNAEIDQNFMNLDADIDTLGSTKANTASPSFTGVSLFGGAVRETRVAVAASNIDLLLGNVFTRTISGATTLTVSNVPASGTIASFILDLTNGGSAAVTWWSGVKWQLGAAPGLTAAGRDVLGFFTHDGGATWTGLLLGKDVK